MSGFGKGGGFGGGAGAGKQSKGRELPYKNPNPDPLENLGELTGDLEKDSNDEVEALGEAFTGFKQRMEQEKSRFDLAVDASYWSGLCFRSHADRTAFLKAVGVQRLYHGQHIDGYELSDVLGLDVEYEDR